MFDLSFARQALPMEQRRVAVALDLAPCAVEGDLSGDGMCQLLLAEG